MSQTVRLARIAPGLAMLRGYRTEWLRYDVTAGLSVAAGALPTAIAYAQLAGFPPVVGLYASILPLVAYGVFGTSRQLIVNPDAATCAMVAAIVAPPASRTGPDRARRGEVRCVVEDQRGVEADTLPICPRKMLIAMEVPFPQREVRLRPE